MSARPSHALSPREWLRLSAFAAAVATLHVAGWGLFLYYSHAHPALAGLGMLACTFGLRHAFDADHIASIDNTTRKLLQQGKRPLGVGFFLSLGHSTIVFSLAAALAVATKTVDERIRPSGATGRTSAPAYRAPSSGVDEVAEHASRVVGAAVRL